MEGERTLVTKNHSLLVLARAAHAANSIIGIQQRLFARGRHGTRRLLLARLGRFLGRATFLVRMGPFPTRVAVPGCILCAQLLSSAGHRACTLQAPCGAARPPTLSAHDEYYAQTPKITH